MRTGSSGRVSLSSKKVKAGGNPFAQAKAEAREAAEKQGEEEKSQLPDAILNDPFKTIPGLKETKDPEIFRKFIQELAPKLALPATSYTMLKAFANIDVTAEKVAQCLKSNPYYEFQFLRVIESMGRRSELPSLEGAVILLGMQNSRNLIVALQILRAVKGQHPEWSKDGKLKVSPNEIIKYALKAEEALAGKREAYPDMAYAAGLVFDILGLLAQEHAQEPKKVQAFIDTTFNHGVRTAILAMELAKAVPDFTYGKYLFGACLLHDIGKIILAILQVDYAPFAEDVGKRGLPRAVRYFVEDHRFHVSHAVLGGLACERFRLFRPVAKSILFHHHPYLLRSANRSLFQLASLICLATNIANNFKKTEKLDDPVVAFWKTEDLRDLKIDVKTMMRAVAKVQI